MVPPIKNNELRQAGITMRLIIFVIDGNDLKVILRKRDREPCSGYYGLPGGYIQTKDSLEESAMRIVDEVTGHRGLYTEQLYTFGDPDRDTKGWWITVAYFALLPLDRKSESYETFSVHDLPELAFDHARMIEYAVQRLTSKIQYSNIVHSLLPTKFRLTQLQEVYEAILGKKIDKRNFRKRMQSLGLLEQLKEKEYGGRHRPAALFRFKTTDPVFFD